MPYTPSGWTADSISPGNILPANYAGQPLPTNYSLSPGGQTALTGLAGKYGGLPAGLLPQGTTLFNPNTTPPIIPVGGTAGQVISGWTPGGPLAAVGNHAKVGGVNTQNAYRQSLIDTLFQLPGLAPPPLPPTTTPTLGGGSPGIGDFLWSGGIPGKTGKTIANVVKKIFWPF